MPLYFDTAELSWLITGTTRLSTVVRCSLTSLLCLKISDPDVTAVRIRLLTNPPTDTSLAGTADTLLSRPIASFVFLLCLWVGRGFSLIIDIVASVTAVVSLASDTAAVAGLVMAAAAVVVAVAIITVVLAASVAVGFVSSNELVGIYSSPPPFLVRHARGLLGRIDITGP